MPKHFLELLLSASMAFLCGTACVPSDEKANSSPATPKQTFEDGGSSLAENGAKKNDTAGVLPHESLDDGQQSDPAQLNAKEIKERLKEYDAVLQDLDAEISVQLRRDAFEKGELKQEVFDLLRQVSQPLDVVMHGGAVSDAGMRQFGELKNLKQLWIQGSGELTGAGVGYVAGLPNLKSFSLDVYTDAITDDDLVVLHKIETLEELSVSTRRNVDGSFLASLSDLPLKEVSLQCLSLSDEGFGAINSLPHLEKLVLYASEVTGEGFGFLKSAKQLHTLKLLDPAKLTKAGLENIALVDSLEQLDIFSAQTLADDDLEVLTAMRNLKDLRLTACKTLTDRSLVHIGRMSQLESLNLQSVSGISSDGLKHLSNLSQLESLNLQSASGISADGLRHLANLKKLSTLDVLNTAITKEHVAELKQQLPNLQVVHVNK